MLFMKRHSYRYRFMAAVVALSFIYAPMSGVVPSWLGLENGSFHTHHDHVWHASGDHHHHLPEVRETGLLETSQLDADAQQIPSSALLDQEQQGRHAPHMHFVDLLVSEGLVAPPPLLLEPGETEVLTVPIFAVTSPLFKPPRSLA